MMGSRRGPESKSGKGTALQRKEKNNGRKRENALTAAFITGWNLPFLDDENDIVNWMKREKNGDNKTKPRPNEERPEENFRHDFTRCQTVENGMEFERESLHERYRKHCQFGPRPSSKKENATHKHLQENILQEQLPARRIRYPRSCKSAELPATPKETTGPRVGLEMPDFSNLTPLMSRSHSVIDDVQLKRYGLTLPPDEKTARLLELAERFKSTTEKNQTSNRSDDEVVDEGYDSKVSSNDAEGLDDDGEESKLGQFDAASVYTNLESLVGFMDNITVSEDVQELAEDEEEFVPQDLGPELGEEANASPKTTTHPTIQNTDSSKDAIAKLMYTRRGRNVYEGTPTGKRSKDNTFKYAGKEQSRLMETSLNHITPGYLNIHNFSHLPMFARSHTVSNLNVEDVEEPTHPLLLHVMQQNNSNSQQQQQLHNNTGDSSEQKTLPMRMISIQDRNMQNENGLDTVTLINPIKGHSSPLHQKNDTTGAINKDGPLKDSQISSSNGASVSGKSLSNSNARVEVKEKSSHLFIQDLSSNIILLPNKLNVSRSTPDNPSRESHVQNGFDQNRPKTPGSNQKPTSPYSQSGRKTPNNNLSSVLLKYYQKEPSMVQHNESGNGQNFSPDTSRTSKSIDKSSERVPSTAFFPVADLLPAVEKNLRRRKKKGQSKQQMIYRSHTIIESLPWKRDNSEMFNPNQLSSTVSSSQGGSATAHGMTVEDLLDKRCHLKMKTQKAYGPPGFRPHHALSPLQRAKEIVNRRLHGHVTHLPDGSETVRVSSPLYQTTRFDRINSASRKLGRMVNGTWKECNDLRSKSETVAFMEKRRTTLTDAHLKGNIC